MNVPSAKSKGLWLWLLVWPGAPQIVQKRHLTGLLWSLGSAALLAVLGMDMIWEFSGQFIAEGKIPANFEVWLKSIHFGRLGFELSLIIGLWLCSAAELYFTLRFKEKS